MNAAGADEAELNPFLRRPLWEDQPTPAVTGCVRKCMVVFVTAKLPNNKRICLELLSLL